MSSFFSQEKGWVRCVNKVVDCICLNFIFLITCIPIFTIGTAFTALYYTVQKTIKNDRGYIGAEYWNAFKTNFKQSTLLWLVLLLISAIMAVDIWILYSVHQTGASLGKAYIFFVVLLAIEVLWMGYVFPYIARFQNTTKEILRNVTVMAILNLPKTILSFINLAIGAVVVYFAPVALFVVPIICACVQNSILEKIFRKYMSEEDRALEDEKNQNYNH